VLVQLHRTASSTLGVFLHHQCPPAITVNMFSEYASRFLQQSNARLSFHQQDNSRNPSRNPLDRRRMPASNSRYVQRPGMPTHPHHNPASSQSHFPFASRFSRQDPQAPLFYSATDDFQEEDEEDEHEREVADFYALQRSRQHFGPSNLTESSELEDDGMEKLEDLQMGQNHDRDTSLPRGRIGAPFRPSSRAASLPDSEASRPSSKGKGRLVEVNLNSTIHEEPPESLANLSPSIDPDEPPAPFEPFRTGLKASRLSSFMPLETDEDTQMQHPRPSSPDRESVPPTVVLPEHMEPPKPCVLGLIIHNLYMHHVRRFCRCVVPDVRAVERDTAWRHCVLGSERKH